MPVIREPVEEEIERNSGEASLLASAKIETFPSDKIRPDEFRMNPITPKTDFAMRQANHLVEKICRDNGVEAPKYSFSKCSAGQEDLIVSLSLSKHASVLRLAEYLHKRGQIERDYALAIQKLNRHLIQTGDTDERLGQLIVMGEKTAAGHMDWARKISEQRIIEELKTICSENEEQRKYLLIEMKKYRGVWSKAVGAFEKVRKNRDKAQKAADSAQLAFDSAMARGNCGKGALARLKEDSQQKAQKAKQARDEYNRAMAALTARQSEIFKDQIPKCFDGLERMERARMAAVRTNLINLAQLHLAVAEVEIESGQRWLKSLVSLSVDDEIEIFVRSVEERAEGQRIAEEIERIDANQDFEDEDNLMDSSAEETIQIYNQGQNEESKLYGNTDLTNSEADLLKALPEIEEINDPRILQERRDKLETIQIKLNHQIEALERMEEAYSSSNAEVIGNKATLEAVRTSKEGIAREIEENAQVLEQINQKLAQLPQPIKKRSAIFRIGLKNEREIDENPMSSILEELNRLDQKRSFANQPPINTNTNANKGSSKKKALSKSFEEILKEGEIESLASPKATGLKLPGAQWTAESISKSNEDLANDDYFCAENWESERIEEMVLNQRTNFRNRLSSIDSQKSTKTTTLEDGGVVDDDEENDFINVKSQSASSGLRRKSIGQTTKNSEASIDQSAIPAASTKIPKNRVELFKVQALYNFIGRKETDELDLCTGEILSVYEASGEWWEAENEAGIRGYIPFNYVIRI